MAEKKQQQIGENTHEKGKQTIFDESNLWEIDLGTLCMCISFSSIDWLIRITAQ